MLVIKIRVRSIVNVLTTNIIKAFQYDEQHNQLPVAFDIEELHLLRDDLGALEEVDDP